MCLAKELAVESQIVNAHCPFDYALFGDAVCTIGVFDGVHIGHRKIIADTIEDAKARGKRSIIITFSVDPDEIYNPDRLDKLMSNDTRLKTLATLGASSVAVLPFDEEFGRLDPMQFLSKVFLKFPPCAIHVGCDFRFGCKASGDGDTLIEWAKKRGCDVVLHDLLVDGGLPVTSTRIRRLKSEKRLDEANHLLGVK